MLQLPTHNIRNGWWPPARRLLSPNHNARPEGAEVSLLVVHNISLPPGEYGGGNIERFFTNQLDPSLHPYFQSIAEMRVSAHCLIHRDGRVTQFVPFDQRAWHAGRSSYAGVAECNDYSIGIELEGTDDSAYSANQYQMLVRLTRDLLRHYPAMTPERITGHCDVAPGRKTDPGPSFDWRLFHQLLNRAMLAESR